MKSDNFFFLLKIRMRGAEFRPFKAPRSGYQQQQQRFERTDRIPNKSLHDWSPITQLFHCHNKYVVSAVSLSLFSRHTLQKTEWGDAHLYPESRI